jgi:hypothetical protein
MRIFFTNCAATYKVSMYLENTYVYSGVHIKRPIFYLVFCHSHRAIVIIAIFSS